MYVVLENVSFRSCQQLNKMQDVAVGGALGREWSESKRGMMEVTQVVQVTHEATIWKMRPGCACEDQKSQIGSKIQEPKKKSAATYAVPIAAAICRR
jgi:hypothetical protein